MESCSRCGGPRGAVSTKRFLQALRLAAKGVSTRPGIPALTCVRLEASKRTLMLTTTDLEITVRQGIAWEGGELDSLVPLKFLTEAVKGHGDSTITPSSDGSMFQAGSFTIRELATEDFPVVKEDTGTLLAGRLPAARFVAMVNAVQGAASRDQARPILTGISIEAESEGVLDFVATDSYRLHVASADMREWNEGKANVPARALVTAAKALGRKPSGGVSIWRSGDLVTIALPNGITIFSRTIEGEYVNWKQLIPDGSANLLTFDVDRMLEQIFAAKVFARENSPVRLELNGTVTISAHSPDLGGYRHEIPSARYEGEDVTIAFNPTYLGDAIAAANGGTLSVRDGLKPAILVGEGVTTLVMPVRLPAPPVS
jgi:DNA polymerase III subunit beta